jgi:cysteinyl-tRNA synthetase
LNDAANASHDFLQTVSDFLSVATDQILGLSVPAMRSGESAEPQLMQLLIALRNDARKSKNFSVSDKIRDDLKAAGIVLEDGKEGTTWKRE